MLCGICWRAPWPIQPAAAGYMALGALHNLCGLGTVASLSVGAPLSSCRSCESFTVRRVGVRGGHLPGVQAGPLHQSILALGSCSSGREELWPLFSRPWELGSPGGPSRPQRDIIRTNSGGYRGGGESSSQGPAQDTASESPSTCVALAITLLLIPRWSPPPRGLFQPIFTQRLAQAF